MIEATYDPGTPVGRVRTLITDIDVHAPMLTDAQVAVFLDLADGSVWAAAASALRAIAVSEVLVQKRIRLLDLSTDGPAEAAALRQLAADYDARAAEDDGEVLLLEPVRTDFAARHILRRRY